MMESQSSLAKASPRGGREPKGEGREVKGVGMDWPIPMILSQASLVRASLREGKGGAEPCAW
jgi:hypothetical protein